MEPLVFGDRLQVAQRLLFHRLNLRLRIQDRFQLPFLADQGPQNLGVVAGEAEFLEPGQDIVPRDLPGRPVGKLRQASLPAIEHRDSRDEVKGVDGFLRRVKEQGGHEEKSLLMHKVGLHTSVGEAPCPQALAEGIEWRC